ncbi:DUF3604 domain-containing protein [Congregibacter brevis]|uniref:DUF3604 domain-containing protein n=1 Tax=Congregibacter brevis TaxID=3081201 RepID=A0ABZ0IC96_9GAMM|nr:DUF3604 domain-containing protein [Congregibacter sp. IMCC45268]
MLQQIAGRKAGFHSPWKALVIGLGLTMSTAAVLAQKDGMEPQVTLKQAFFGELHLHTAYSLDAYIGGARLTPSMAYRFAKGESMTVNGQPHSIGRPLDFAAITDHAEYIGEMQATQVTGTPGYDNEKLHELRNLSSYEEQEAWFLREVVANSRGGGPKHTAFYPGEVAVRSAWQLMVSTANDHYEPGTFTTLIGYEWSAAPKGGNMHRNVVFRDDHVPALPFSSIDSPDEEDLWKWMGAQEELGSTLLAIPHNSNASKGFMFEPVDNSGNPLDFEYARLRSHFEPLIEMMQIKGNSEVHRKFWPADEFADFENADSVETHSKRTYAKKNFVRAAVIDGLAYEQSLDANPYKLGFVGGTDSHNGTPGDVVESTYVGSHGAADGSVERRRVDDIPGWIAARDSSPGSITGVYASENTRGAIFDALRARETFVTSGPRLKPRFFAGANLPEAVDNSREMLELGYSDGLPMGSTLTALSESPRFYIHAMKDPEGANLDRVQIIKGWVDSDGKTHERIYDAVVSDGRTINESGRCTIAVGNTVDVATATYRNSIGATELMTTWSDPDFDPRQPALYYTRTLEIPTPRWTTYDAVRFNQPLLDDVPATVQERAWSSPIWYVP